MGRYLIYTQTNCVYCKMAKELLVKEGHVFDEIIIASAKDINEFKELGFTQVPQIYEHVGGYTELKDKLNKNLIANGFTEKYVEYKEKNSE